MLKPVVRTIGVAVLALAWTSGVQAQKPVYLCDGVYTDQPCKAGKEVDIAPTRGLDSMSGQRRESLQVMQERMTESSARAQKRGEEEAQRQMRCADLRRQRLAIDSTSQDKKLVDARLAIREEQFRLKCSRT